MWSSEWLFWSGFFTVWQHHFRSGRSSSNFCGLAYKMYQGVCQKARLAQWNISGFHDGNLNENRAWRWAVRHAYHLVTLNVREGVRNIHYIQNVGQVSFECLSLDTGGGRTVLVYVNIKPDCPGDSWLQHTLEQFFMLKSMSRFPASQI